MICTLLVSPLQRGSGRRQADEGVLKHLLHNAQSSPLWRFLRHAVLLSGIKKASLQGEFELVLALLKP